MKRTLERVALNSILIGAMFAVVGKAIGHLPMMGAAPILLGFGGIGIFATIFMKEG